MRKIALLSLLLLTTPLLAVAQLDSAIRDAKAALAQHRGELARRDSALDQKRQQVDALRKAYIDNQNELSAEAKSAEILRRRIDDVEEQLILAQETQLKLYHQAEVQEDLAEAREDKAEAAEDARVKKALAAALAAQGVIIPPEALNTPAPAPAPAPAAASPVTPPQTRATVPVSTPVAASFDPRMDDPAQASAPAAGPVSSLPTARAPEASATNVAPAGIDSRASTISAQDARSAPAPAAPAASSSTRALPGRTAPAAAAKPLSYADALKKGLFGR